MVGDTLALAGGENIELLVTFALETKLLYFHELSLLSYSVCGAGRGELRNGMALANT